MDGIVRCCCGDKNSAPRSPERSAAALTSRPRSIISLVQEIKEQFADALSNLFVLEKSDSKPEDDVASPSHG